MEGACAAAGLAGDLEVGHPGQLLLDARHRLRTRVALLLDLPGARRQLLLQGTGEIFALGTTTAGGNMLAVAAVAPDGSLIRNFDARWEWYPAPGEIFSVALFGKQFDEFLNPDAASIVAVTVIVVLAPDARDANVQGSATQEALAPEPATPVIVRLAAFSSNFWRLEV